VCHIPLCKNNHQPIALQILRGPTSYVLLGSINLLSSLLINYISDIIIFLVISLFLALAVSNIPLCKNSHRPNALQILRRPTSYVPLGSINFLLPPLYYYIHEIIKFPLIFAIFCSGRGKIQLCKTNHQPSALVIAHLTRPHGPLRFIHIVFPPLYHYIPEIMTFLSIFAIF
jgi:hypothetical protein